ncbi:MAG: ABC transporter ATP-binding protein [Synergistaceae bacterium]|jgi:branched-chain amino acid transport system ATP-binding protein|nr:ABC transporter ATP-binding protein [Synergistaceae bacterium]
MELLEVHDVTKRFGGLTAVGGVEMYVSRGEIVGLIGPNGAGKTTLFSCISGLYGIDSGEIWLDGHRIDGLSPHKICALKLARTFQIVKAITRMTVLENIMVGAFMVSKLVSGARERAREVMDFCGLSRLADVKAGALTIGDKKRLEVARALATEPELLLLDEVMAGLTARESQEAVELIFKIRNWGVTVLMVEHIMEIIMPISDRIVVLDSGLKIAEGRPEEIARDERVIEAYLGGTP